MFPRINGVRHLGEYRLDLNFTDGTKAEIDLRDRVVSRGGVFTPLEDIAFFKQVRVDPEAGTIVWPNEVDFCPDVVYSIATHPSVGHRYGSKVPKLGRTTLKQL